MKTKLLKKLREKHCIVTAKIRVLTTLYSVKPLHKFPAGIDEPDMVKWYSYSHNEAKTKQRELILESLKKYTKEKQKQFSPPETRSIGKK